MVTLVADGGEITVGRQMANYVYGSWEVNAPDEVEEEEKDDRTDWAFIYRPDNRTNGRFDISFVRADASMDMELHESETEQVIDTATKRVSGEVFFEREISGPGLGRYVPGKHFRVGDIVDVRLWWKTMALPVTAIDLSTKTDNPLGYEVHVGGQVISDAEKLRQHNDKISRQIAADKRKAEKELGQVRSTATSAKQTAEQVRQDLGLPTGETGGLFGQYLSRLGVDGDVTKDLLRINATLWDEQYGWNATQEAINDAQQKINEVNEQRINDQEAAMDALRAAQTAAMQQQVRMAYVDASNSWSDQFITASVSSSTTRITAKGAWTGRVFLSKRYDTTHLVGGEGSGRSDDTITDLDSFTIPQSNGSRTYSGAGYEAQIQYLVDPGEQKTRDLISTETISLPGATWAVDGRRTFTAPVTGYYAVWYRVTWETPQSFVNYGIDITRNGNWIAATGLQQGVFPTKEHSLRINSGDSGSLFYAGDTIEFRLFSGASGFEPGRRVSRVETKISWIEENL